MTLAYICTAPTATLYHVDIEHGWQWHDGAGWYYVDDEYPEEGCVGAFVSETEARAHATTAWDPPYTIEGAMRNAASVQP